MTFRTEDIGKFRLLAGGVDAVERDFGDGGTSTIYCPAAGGRRHERCVPGVRHLAQDRLQNFNRYKDDGLEALTDRSRRPVRYANQLQLGDGRYCYPLTVTDQASHYLLACEAFESTRERAVFDAFGRLFAERGLPLAIRSDNGLPFASPNGALQSIEAVGLVAAARHRAGAHQAGPSAREWPGRW